MNTKKELSSVASSMYVYNNNKPQKMAPKFEVILGVASFLGYSLYLD
jgi:hypothetical protein